MEADPTRAAPLAAARMRRRAASSRGARLNVWLIASEAAPWAKTGGLGDVAGALPAALARLGHRVNLVVPRYRGVDPGQVAPERREVRIGDRTLPVTLWRAPQPAGHQVVFVDCPAFFDRPGLYGTAGHDFPDNAERFALLALAALDAAEADERPVDVLHAHDWQAGLVPAYLRFSPARWPRLAASAGLVFTIHNLAFQGLFARETVPRLGLDWGVFTLEGAEFWRQLSFLKAGINYSDWVTTVSPRYAAETQTPADGAGFDGVLRARRGRYVGILNGIDTEMWDPEADPWLPARYSVDDLSGKAVCKRVLLERFGLAAGDDAATRPLIGVVSRLVEQKGFDLVEAAGDRLLALDAAWTVVGSGEPRYEAMWRALAARWPARAGVFVGFSEERAHLVEAGADMFLMPSRFEPCGLNQMYSLRYGTVPIVRGVGGLDDTVRPYTGRARRANGFKFHEATGEALVRTVRQAIRVYHDRPVWRTLIRHGMTDDHSWTRACREYVKVYGWARRDGRARVGM